MKPDVGERPDGLLTRRRALHVVQAEGRAVALQQCECPPVVPAGIAELDDVPAALRKGLQKVLEPLEVQRPAGWELIEDRAQLRGEVSRTGEEQPQRTLGVTRTSR